MRTSIPGLYAIGDVTGGIQLDATPEQVAQTTHAHPTLPEAMTEAAHGVSGQAIHVARARPRQTMGQQ